MAVSIDAAKVRGKLGEEVDENGKKTIEIGFKDARIAGISYASILHMWLGSNG